MNVLFDHKNFYKFVSNFNFDFNFNFTASLGTNLGDIETHGESHPFKRGQTFVRFGKRTISPVQFGTQICKLFSIKIAIKIGSF